MKTFSEYLQEGTSMDEDLLGHLTHVKDIPHEAPDHLHTAIDAIRQFSNLRQGKKSDVSASLKHDGGASVHVVHDKNGTIGVSDKHRLARGVIAKTDNEIDQHFGKHEAYAESLKHLRAHGHEIVAKGHHVQGDILWSGHGGGNEYTPNRITYNSKSHAPIGLAIHTEVTDGVAHALSHNAVKSSKNVFVPREDFKHTEHPYSKEAQAAVEKHLTHAEKLGENHTTDHMTPDHIQHLTIYHNRVARGHQKPTVDGYAKYLKSRGELEASVLKTTKGQERVKSKYSAMVDHVNANSEHFHRSIQIRHHLQAATDHSLEGIRHPDLETSIDGKKSMGEGIVLRRPDAKGRVRPFAKLVHSDVQKALGNNPRFSTGKNSITEEKESHVHAFFGKVQYATIGHRSVIDSMREAAKKDGGKTVVGLSNTPGPLGRMGKKKHAESILGHPVETGDGHTENLMTFVKHLHDQGHTHLTLHAGSDRAGHYKKLLDSYNGRPTKTGEVLFNFKKIKVHKVGEDRDESDSVKDPRNMSHSELLKTAKASRLRGYAKDGSEEAKQKFHAYHKPLGLPKAEVNQHWENLKTAMKTYKEPVKEDVASFNEYVMTEKVLNIGLSPNHEKHRELHRDEIHSIMRKSYAGIGGYSGLGSGSDKESRAIHADIDSHNIKAVKRDGKVVAAIVYKQQKGRKVIALGSDGSEQGRKDVAMLMKDDAKMKRSWGEYSGAVAHINRERLKLPVHSSSRASEILDKKTEPVSDTKYTRDIGGHPHTKEIMGTLGYKGKHGK